MTHRLDRSKFVFKEEMIFTLIDFIKHKECDNDLEESADLDPEMWVKLIDRGGLVHCTNDFFVFLHELVVAKSIFKQATHTKGIDIPNIIKEIKSKTDIILTWNSVCSTTELVKSEVYEKVQDDLLTEILRLYITLRGFAFVSRWMENFKLSRSKILQRSKSLRAKLQQSDS